MSDPTKGWAVFQIQPSQAGGACAVKVIETSGGGSPSENSSLHPVAVGAVNEKMNSLKRFDVKESPNNGISQIADFPLSKASVHKDLKHAESSVKVLHDQHGCAGFDDHACRHASQQHRCRTTAAARGHDFQADVLFLCHSLDCMGHVGPLFEDRRDRHMTAIDGCPLLGMPSAVAERRSIIPAADQAGVQVDLKKVDLIDVKHSPFQISWIFLKLSSRGACAEAE